MNEVQKAAFAFTNYKIPSFRFSESDNPSEEYLQVFFDPSGVYDVQDGIFQLHLNFKGYEGSNESEREVIQCELIAEFEFKDKPLFEAIPKYFYANAIAIVFPYLRAFISTMTLQANVKMVKLPLLNLTGLEEKFRNNTKSTITE